MKARKIVRNRRKMDEKGVSPVIGVILMVAATIVIAAVVMGMLGGFSPPKKVYAVSATASVQSSGGTTTLYITYKGGPDHSQVDAISATITDSTGASVSFTAPPGWGTVDNSNSDVIVGTTLVESNGTYTISAANDDHVVVTATFLDGSTQVILDTYL